MSEIIASRGLSRQMMAIVRTTRTSAIAGLMMARSTRLFTLSMSPESRETIPPLFISDNSLSGRSSRRPKSLFRRRNIIVALSSID